MQKNKMAGPLVLGAMAIAGLAAGIATMAGAQSASVAAVPAPAIVSTAPVSTDVSNSQQAVDVPEAGDTPDVPGATGSAFDSHEYAPLGRADKAGDADGTSAKEAGESAASADSSGE